MTLLIAFGLALALTLGYILIIILKEKIKEKWHKLKQLFF